MSGLQYRSMETLCNYMFAELVNCLFSAHTIELLRFGPRILFLLNLFPVTLDGVSVKDLIYK